MSFDMKLLFVFHGAIMILFLIGSQLTVSIELAVAGGLATVLAMVAIVRRMRLGWRWPGATPLRWLGALGTLLLGLVFAGASSFQFPPTSASALPWYLGLGGIVAFNLLTLLGLSHTTEAEFRASFDSGNVSVGRAQASIIETRQRTWQSLVVGVYRLLFFAAWLTFVAFIAADGWAMRDGSPALTAEAIIPLTEHGRTVYLPVWQGQIVEGLKLAGMIGIPSVIALGFLLHFGLGVKIFDNLPTWRRDEP